MFTCIFLKFCFVVSEVVHVTCLISCLWLCPIKTAFYETVHTNSLICCACHLFCLQTISPVSSWAIAECFSETGESYGKKVEWMDSVNQEVEVWERMLSEPNTWVEGMLPLRSSMTPRKWSFVGGYKRSNECLSDYVPNSQCHGLAIYGIVFVIATSLWLDQMLYIPVMEKQMLVTLGHCYVPLSPIFQKSLSFQMQLIKRYLDWNKYMSLSNFDCWALCVSLLSTKTEVKDLHVSRCEFHTGQIDH